MYTAIQKWGNSQAVRIPKPIMEAVRFKENEQVEIIANDGIITIKKSTKKKYNSLEDIFEGYTGNYKCEEWDTGHIGKEVF